jgi:hypothetical protein
VVEIREYGDWFGCLIYSTLTGLMNDSGLLPSVGQSDWPTLGWMIQSLQDWGKWCRNKKPRWRTSEGCELKLD